MREMINYLKARYLSEKAQGIAEYALILAFVVVVAAALLSGGDLNKAVQGAFTKMTNAINGTKA